MLTKVISHVAAVALSFCSLGVANECRADDVLRASTKPLYFTTGIGPAIGFAICDQSANCLSGSPQTAAMWYNEFGGHFSGDGSGPLLAGYLHLGGGPIAGANAVRFGVGPKFGWDIPVYNKAVFLQPSTSIGYGFTAQTGGGAIQHYVQWMLSGQVKMVLNDVGVLYFQPITFEVDGNDNGALLYWNLLLGGGASF